MGTSSRSLKELEQSLRKVTNTQQSIEEVSRFMLKFVGTAKDAVDVWDREFGNLAAKRLELLYVANDVIQTSKRKHGDAFVDPFSTVVGQAMRVFVAGSDKNRERVSKILKLWEDRKVMNLKQLAKIRADLENPNASSLLREVSQNPMAIEDDPSVMAESASIILSKSERKVVDLMKELDNSGVMAEFLADKVSNIKSKVKAFEEATNDTQVEPVKPSRDGYGDEEEYNLVETSQTVEIDVQECHSTIAERSTELKQEIAKRSQLEEALAVLLEDTISGMGSRDDKTQIIESQLQQLSLAKKMVEQARSELIEKHRQEKAERQPTRQQLPQQSFDENSINADAEAFLSSLTPNVTNSRNSGQHLMQQQHLFTPAQAYGNMPSHPSTGVGGPFFNHGRGPPHNMVHSNTTPHQPQANVTGWDAHNHGNSSQPQYQPSNDSAKRVKRSRWGHPDDKVVQTAPTPMQGTAFSVSQQQQLQMLQQHLQQQQQNQQFGANYPPYAQSIPHGQPYPSHPQQPRSNWK